MEKKTVKKLCEKKPKFTAHPSLKWLTIHNTSMTKSEDSEGDWYHPWYVLVDLKPLLPINSIYVTFLS